MATGRTRCFRLRSKMSASFLVANATKNSIKNKLFPPEFASTSSRLGGGRFDHLPMLWRGMYMAMLSTAGSNRLATAWRCNQRGSACIAIFLIECKRRKIDRCICDFSDNHCGTLYFIVCQCLASLATGAAMAWCKCNSRLHHESRHNEYFC